ncbi:hypothetical protein C8R47DRAFT_1297086 [Mycena vitilis]|nr:hypothetical protein C8R47DRAFT_1297086 [Mycena vitilis]
MPSTSTPTSASQKSDVEAQLSMPPTVASHFQEESERSEATADSSSEETPAGDEDIDSDSDAGSDCECDSDCECESDTDIDFDKPHFYCHESETGSFTISIGCNFPVDAEQRAGGLDPVGRNCNMPRSSRRRPISNGETSTMEERHAYWEDVKRRCEEEIREEEQHEAENAGH